jgi:hypothetical protein
MCVENDGVFVEKVDIIAKVVLIFHVHVSFIAITFDEKNWRYCFRTAPHIIPGKSAMYSNVRAGYLS